MECVISKYMYMLLQRVVYCFSLCLNESNIYGHDHVVGGFLVNNISCAKVLLMY